MSEENKSFTLRLRTHKPEHTVIKADSKSDQDEKLVEGSVWVVRGRDWDVRERKHFIVLERVDNPKAN
ncbi:MULTISPECIES: hypothetical protein [unclassified Bradyrhizobium]|uniref:hypothetical protein n=1 Tax=unclassified Bradyrhizobium TaxID=2631580 RepID=UPI003390F2EA